MILGMCSFVYECFKKILNREYNITKVNRNKKYINIIIIYFFIYFSISSRVFAIKLCFFSWVKFENIRVYIL